MNLQDCLQEEVSKAKLQMKKEELIIFAKKRKECNERAQKIVERLLDTVTEEMFLDVVKYLNQAYLNDIFEERSIVYICGYPVCENKLVTIPKQQYKISMATNKVYDITERKKFCSAQCFSAAKYIREQLPSSPLWVMENEDSRHYRLWNYKKSTCLDGDEVKFKIADFKKADIAGSRIVSENKTKIIPDNNVEKCKDIKDSTRKENNSLNLKSCDINACQDPSNLTRAVQALSLEEDSVQSSISNSMAGISKIKGNESDPINSEIMLKQDSTIGSTDKVLLTQSKNLVDPMQNVNPANNLENEILTKRITCTSSNNAKNPDVNTKHKCAGSIKSPVMKKKQPANEDLKNPVIFLDIVRNTLQSWITIDSLVYLLGEEQVKAYCLSVGHQLDAQIVPKLSPRQLEQYNKICKKLDLIEMQEQQQAERRDPSKPLPDYNSLKRQNYEMMIKVRAFYEGSTSIPIGKLDDHSEETGNESKTKEFLPLTDHHDQKIMRRNIVLSFLEPAISKFLFDCKIRETVLSELRQLVHTFELDAKNITFKPALQRLIALFVIKLLAMVIKNLELKLSDTYASEIYAQTLRFYDISAKECEEVITTATRLSNVIPTKKLIK